MHELEKMIQEGEHLHQDFKYFLSDAKKIARSLSAFANTDGGQLLVGVKDNGKIVGLKHKDEEAYVVEAAARVFCHPEVEYTTHTWAYAGKLVLQVLVPKGTKGPYSAPDEKGNRTFYLRKADENKMANPLEQAILEIRHSETPLSVQFTKQYQRLLTVFRELPPEKRTAESLDINQLCTRCMLTRQECIAALAQIMVRE